VSSGVTTARVALIGLVWLLGVAGLAGAIVSACYDVPMPDCGFLCGTNGECPNGYTCADDHICHRTGAPADLVCTASDVLAPHDAAVDAPQRIDAPIDAEIDAPAPMP
jgi:hypothetical protein